MSFLTFLCFATVVYLCVVADPIAEPASAALSDQEQINTFIKAIEESYDKHFAMLLHGLDEGNLAYLKETTMDGITGFINFCLFQAKQETNQAPEDENDIIMQFVSPDTFYPGAAYEEPPVVAQKDKST